MIVQINGITTLLFIFLFEEKLV